MLPSVDVHRGAHGAGAPRGTRARTGLAVLGAVLVLLAALAHAAAPRGAADGVALAAAAAATEDARLSAQPRTSSAREPGAGPSRERPEGRERASARSAPVTGAARSGGDVLAVVPPPLPLPPPDAARTTPAALAPGHSGPGAATAPARAPPA